MTYAIYEGNMERLSKKMARIQNKCREYGCDFKFEEVGEEYREIKGEDGEMVMVRFVLVEAEGKAEINGWKFIASVEHTERGNIIKAACDIEVPERYYNCEPMCEHCGTKRFRKYLFIVMNEESGEFKMVGKSCLKDFTGGMSAEAVAEYTAAFESIITAESPVGAGEIKTYYNVREYLNTVAETIRHFGYVKRVSEYSDSYNPCTAVKAEDYYQIEHGAHFFYGMDKEIRAEMEAVGFNSSSAEAARETEAALEWLAEQKADNNYMHNLEVACGLEYTERRNLGILASLFPTYNRELTKQAEKKAQAEQSEWVGEIGQRIEIEIKEVRVITSWATEWGHTIIWKIIDTNGNVFIWKTGNDIPENAKTIKGTVKAHNEYAGVKQTELTRCKITGREPEEEAEWSYKGSAEEGLDLFFEQVEG